MMFPVSYLVYSVNYLVCLLASVVVVVRMHADEAWYFGWNLSLCNGWLGQFWGEMWFVDCLLIGEALRMVVFNSHTYSSLPLHTSSQGLKWCFPLLTGPTKAIMNCVDQRNNSGRAASVQEGATKLSCMVSVKLLFNASTVVLLFNIRHSRGYSWTVVLSFNIRHSRGYSWTVVLSFNL